MNLFPIELQVIKKLSKSYKTKSEKPYQLREAKGDMTKKHRPILEWAL